MPAEEVAAEVELLALLHPGVVPSPSLRSLRLEHESHVTGLKSLLSIDLPDDYPKSPPQLTFESPVLKNAYLKALGGELEPGEPCLLRIVDAFKAAVDASEELCPSCSICLCPITLRGDRFSSTCEHMFHVECFEEWRASTIERKTSSTVADDARARRKQRESAAENDAKLAEQAVKSKTAERDAAAARIVVLKARKTLPPQLGATAQGQALKQRKPVVDVRNEPDEELVDVAEIDRRLAQLNLDLKALGTAAVKAKTKLRSSLLALDAARAALEQEEKAELATISIPCPVCRSELKGEQVLKST